MLSPCCGSSLQQGTKFLAIISGVSSLIVLVISGISVFGMLVIFIFGNTNNFGPVKLEDGTELHPRLAFLIVLIFFILTGVGFIISILLFIAAEQKNLRLLKLWVKVTILRLGIIIILLVGKIFSPLDLNGESLIVEIILHAIDLIYMAYQLWVVIAFIFEIQNPPTICNQV